MLSNQRYSIHVMLAKKIEAISFEKWKKEKPLLNKKLSAVSVLANENFGLVVLGELDDNIKCECIDDIIVQNPEITLVRGNISGCVYTTVEDGKEVKKIQMFDKKRQQKTVIKNDIKIKSIVPLLDIKNDWGKT